MTAGRALTRLVILDGEVWEAGSVPPPEVAERIRNPLCWESIEGDYQLPWGPEGMPAVSTASQAVIPAAPAGGGLPNLQELAGGTEQSGVIPADQGNVIGRDPLEPLGQPNLAGEIEGDVVEQPELPPATTPPPPSPEPPRSGKGATEAAWRRFAADRDIQVAENADRSQVIAACREAGVIQ